MTQEKRVLTREYPSAPIVGVGAVVIEAGRVLLVRRNREPLLGQWSVPGGAVELGETLEQAIVREVAEETGVAIAPTTVLKAFDRIERDSAGRVRFHYVLIDFLCKVENMPESLCAATDVSDAQWVSVEKLRHSREFILPDWTLEVIEEGWRRAST
jgi:8-oxo-dGTP diphosphatase